MRIALLFLALGAATELVLAARSGPGRSSSSSAAPRRSSSSTSSSSTSSSSRGGGGRGGRSPTSSGRGGGGGGGSKRRVDPVDDDVVDENDDVEEDEGYDVVEEEAEDDAAEDDDDDDDDRAADEYDGYDERPPRAARRGPPAASSAGGRGAAARPRRGGPPPRSSSSRGGAGGRRGGGSRTPPRHAADYDEDDYDEDRPPRRRGGAGGGDGRGPTPPPSSSRGGRPSRRGSSGGGRGEGRVVSYKRGPPPPSAFTRGLSAIRDVMPDPNAVKDTVLSATRAAQERTARLTANAYREMKGLTSSELEQVMLKATRPDDGPVKSKHVERLVGVTYQISGKYDIYDAVLRKLWNKMAERDMRTKLKSVYVLHRFAVDGGPDHQEALKQRLRALRKTKDPKRSTGGRGGTRYFDSKVLIGADDDVSLYRFFVRRAASRLSFPPSILQCKPFPLFASVQPDSQGYRAFLSRYAHYVLTRAQTFGGIFSEISPAPSSAAAPPPSKKGGGGRSKAPGQAAKPKTPPLCEEHLKFAQMVLKAGLACTLHDGEDSESTAMCVERVAADLMGLVSAVAAALRRELKQPYSSPLSSGDENEVLVRRWCEFYAEELLPETKKFCKKVTGKLDAYGLYLPSRMSASLSPELLERGLKLGSGGERGEDAAGVDEKDGGAAAEEEPADESKSETRAAEEKGDRGAAADVGDPSPSTSANADASTPGDEDEYYDQYDEYDEYD
jgi:hypothetical protein